MKCIQWPISRREWKLIHVAEQNDNFTLLLVEHNHSNKQNYGVLTTLWTKESLPFFPAAYSCLIIGAIKFCAIVNIIKSLLINYVLKYIIKNKQK